MNSQPTKGDLEYQVEKLQRNREEVRQMGNQYRPGSKQHEAYFIQGSNLEEEINALRKRIVDVGGKA